MNEPEIKPCPFCGAEISDTVETKTPGEWYYHVWCWRCHSESGWYKTRWEAIEHWNQRQQKMP